MIDWVSILVLAALGTGLAFGYLWAEHGPRLLSNRMDNPIKIGGRASGGK